MRKVKLMANTPHALSIVCGPSREDVGRVFASDLAATASGRVKAMERAQIPSIKTQFHSANVIENQAFAIWLMVSTCPYITMYL